MRTTLILALLLSTAIAAQEPSWPQWRGPSRDGVAAGVASVESWPASLTRRWRVPVDAGYSTPVFARGLVVVHGREGERETVTALAIADGRRVWQDAYPAPYKVNTAAAGHGAGPKSTPVIAGTRVCTLGISGILSCYDLATGRVLWRKQPSKEQPLYGVAMSPVVDEGRLVAHVGGHDSGALAAFDVETGAERWQWTGGAPAYASPVIATLAGVRQIVTQSRTHVVGLSATDGRLLWQIPFTTNYDQNSVTPLVTGDLVIYSGLGNGVTAVRVVKRGAGFATEEAWRNPDLPMYMSTPVVAGSAIVGLSHRNRGQYFAVDAATGRTLWTTRGREAENAALLRAGSRTLVFTDAGTLLVVRDNPERFDVEQQYELAESAAWAHPAMADRHLIVRDASSVALWAIE